MKTKAVLLKVIFFKRTQFFKGIFNSTRLPTPKLLTK